MSVAEIVMLIVGAILFTVSFFMPDRNNTTAQLDEEEEKKIIEDLLKQEVDKYKYEMEEAAEECVNDNRDKLERAMDRITNEKMSAVNEYSDTVIEQIRKNHEEAMFLYDMLNNKHSQVKNTAAEINQLSKSVKAATNAVENNQASKTATSSELSKMVQETAPVEEKKQEKGFGYVTPNPNRTSDNKGFGYTEIKADDIANIKGFETLQPEKVELDVIGVNKEETPKKKKSAKEKEVKVPVADSSVDLMFDSDKNLANSNDRILALHKEGKSNMAIAKELGLGIGEVKLVIDLFEGI